MVIAVFVFISSFARGHGRGEGGGGAVGEVEKRESFFIVIPFSHFFSLAPAAFL